MVVVAKGRNLLHIVDFPSILWEKISKNKADISYKSREFDGTLATPQKKDYYGISHSELNRLAKNI